MSEVTRQPYIATPRLKLCEWSVDQGGGAYISFEEYIDVPGLESADIRLEFKKDNSLEEVSKLMKTLKDMGLRFVVQK